MKQVKLIIALFIAVVIIFSCKSKDTKPVTVKVEKKEMSNDDFSKEFGFDIVPFLPESVKSAAAAATAKGKPVKIPVVVWFHSLKLTKEGTFYRTTIPVNSLHCGFQDLTNKTSPYSCRWYLTMDTVKTCDESQFGVGTTKRTYSTVTYSNDVYVSNTLQ